MAKYKMSLSIKSKFDMLTALIDKDEVYEWDDEKFPGQMFTMSGQGLINRMRFFESDQIDSKYYTLKILNKIYKRYFSIRSQL